jgi:nicotinamidase/pyrazinamidase
MIAAIMEAMPVSYDDRTALLVVDVQNDFADPDGNLYVKGGEEVVGRANLELDRAAEAGATVVYSQDWHPPSTPHFEKDGGVWPVHCVAGTWGAEFHPDLRRLEGAEVVRKGVEGEDGYSAFSVRQPTTGESHGTGLDDLLRRRNVERVVVVGLATDYCVKETVLDAVRAGFEATVLTDGVRAVDLQEGDGERALAEVRAAGATLE